MTHTAWPEAPLGELCDVLSGFAWDSERFSDAGELPLVRIRDVVRGRSTTFYTGPYDPKFVVKDGDLLIGMDGEFNRASWRGGEALLNQRVCRVKADASSLDDRFLYHFLPKVLQTIEDGTPFATVKHLSVPKLKSVAVPVPPIEEQRRIAAVLDKADELRAKRRAALAQLDTLTESIFLDMFGDPIANARGWDRAPLTTLGDLDRGVSRHRPRNAPELLGGEHPLIQTGDVANSGGYITTYSSTYSDIGLRQSKMWPAGTLCITIAANIAKTGLLTFDACFPDSVVGFASSDPATVEYVRLTLAFLQQSLERAAPESAQKNINLAVLRGLQVPIPPQDLRDRFAELLTAVRRTKAKQLADHVIMEDLFALLQQRAFRSEL